MLTQLFFIVTYWLALLVLMDNYLELLYITDFITGLLNSIGTHVDPIILIRRIQTGMEIPGLRDSLVKILQDYNLQVQYMDQLTRFLYLSHLWKWLINAYAVGLEV